MFHSARVPCVEKLVPEETICYVIYQVHIIQLVKICAFDVMHDVYMIDKVNCENIQICTVEYYDDF